MQLSNTNEILKSEEQLIPEGKYDFPEANDAVNDAIAQKNNELLEKDPNEYLIWLLNNLEKWQELTTEEQNMAQKIITELFKWKKYSMKDIFGMNSYDKAELSWKLSAMIRYDKNENYTSITDWLREGRTFQQLKIRKNGWTLGNPTKNDFENFFKDADAFHKRNMWKIYTGLYPTFNKEDIPTMPEISFNWNINWNDSISENFSNVWREYYSYNLSDLDSDKVNL